MKTKLTLKFINDKLNRQQKEIRELRDTMFRWGQQNMKDIDEIKKELIERKELK